MASRVSPHIPSQSMYEVNPPPHISYSAFKERFSLKELSTEKENLRTQNLSRVMQESTLDGLTLLLDEEMPVIAEFKRFAPQLNLLPSLLALKAKMGGRIIFVGVGSSGRVGIDLAAKATALCPQLKCLGILGGGDAALVQSKEGFEDSPDQGGIAAEKLNLTSADTIFLISASGATAFNVGFGHEAANTGAHVYYFYNSKEVPTRTQELFDRKNNPIRPLMVDTGPQAILGSTRLQAYNIARICFSYVLDKTIIAYAGDVHETFSIDVIANKLTLALERVRTILPELARIIQAEYLVFSSPQSNFRRIRDQTDEGYVTLIGTPSSIRDLLIECAETPPTFFLHQRRRESEGRKRRAEYQAYLVGEVDNQSAWKVALGRDPHLLQDRREVSQYLLAEKVEGLESYANRPKGTGNLVIGTDLLRKGEVLSESLLASLREAKAAGGTTVLTVISEDPRSTDERLSDICDTILWVDQIEDDPFGLIFTQMLKWMCSLTSNSVMTKIGKISGNRMIDLRTSTNKLIDRCMRLIHELWHSFHPRETLNDKELYHLIISIYDKQKECQERGEYTPSTLKIALAMLERKCSFEEAVRLLGYHEENIDSLFLSSSSRAKL